MVDLYKMSMLDILYGGGDAMADPIEIPASEVRERISDVLSRVAYGRERVIISRNGKPVAALISIDEFDWLRQFDREKEEARLAFGKAVEAIRERAARTGLDKMTDEEIDALIKDVRRERRARGETE